jgi:hypothetical protein
MDQIIESGNYPFAWLDEIFEVTLNPEVTSVDQLGDEQLAFIETNITNELKRVIGSLKTTTFFLLNTEKINTVVRQYDFSLQELLSQALRNLAQYPDTDLIAAFGERVVIVLKQAKELLRARYARYFSEIEAKTEKPGVSKSILSKITCKLSVDQLAIILKAADEAKILMARSLSHVFQSIIPYLSTERIKNISWKSARSSTYKIEENDKAAAIAILELLIARIRKF